MFFSKKEEIVGLDIGSSLIKAVELKKGPKGFQLKNFGFIPLDPEIIVDGSIIDASRVVEGIRRLFEEQKFKSKDVTISVSGHASVIIKRVTIPEMSEEELRESIRWEAEQYIPFSIDEVELDFQILSPSKTGTGQMDVLLVAVKKDKINDYVTVAKEAGLNPVVVDVDVFAIENMYELNYEMEVGKNIALVNIGANTTNVNIIKDNVSLFTRDSSMGGNQITKAIQKEFSLSFENAEKAKRGEEVHGVSPNEVYPIIQNISRDFASEVSRSIDFFKSTTVGEDVEKVILSGGCAKMRMLSNILSENLDALVITVNPFNNIYTDPKTFDAGYVQDIAPIAAVAVGLAIRKVGDK